MNRMVLWTVIGAALVNTLAVPSASAQAPKSEKSKVEIDARIYTKWLYRNDDTQGVLWLGNPFWPDDIAGNNGVASEVELIFKELKSRYELDHIITKSPYAIEALIWISILTLLISRKVYSIVRKLNPDAKMVRFTQLRWSNIFVQNSSRLLSAIMEYLGLEQDFSTVLNVYSSEALDPHVNRERFREGLWS